MSGSYPRGRRLVTRMTCFWILGTDTRRLTRFNNTTKILSLPRANPPTATSSFAFCGEIELGFPLVMHSLWRSANDG